MDLTGVMLLGLFYGDRQGLFHQTHFMHRGSNKGEKTQPTFSDPRRSELRLGTYICNNSGIRPIVPMSTLISQLQPADKKDVIVYQPYYPDKNKQKLLPLALALYQLGQVEGARQIEGGESLSFAATWFVSRLPSELTRCRMQFEGQAELSYEMTVLNSEFMDYLIDLIAMHEETKAIDFPQNFYRKLLRVDEAPATPST